MYKIAVVIVALFGIASASFSEQEYQAGFTQWMHKNGKQYAASEFQNRFVTFKNNMDFVEKWNSDPSHTHQVALNHLADLSNEEYRRILLGTKIDGTNRLAKAQNKTETIFSPLPKTVTAPFGDIVNWELKGAVTPVKNQGQCGSCYSFSATGSIEGINEIVTGNLVSLSEAQIMDCSSSYGNNGCNGGLMDNVFQYVIACGGLDTEASYPYSGAVQTCKFNPANVGGTISSYADVNSGDENDLLNHSNQQPVSVAIDASHTSFQLYSSGVYSEPACSSSTLDHGVLVVGYGTSSADYWIVKNSWGADWGMSGYIQMSRNANNQCGIATSASVPLKN